MRKAWKRLGTLLLAGSLLVDPVPMNKVEAKGTTSTKVYQADTTRKMSKEEQKAYEMTVERTKHLKMMNAGSMSGLKTASKGTVTSSGESLPTRYDSVSLGFGSEVKDQGSLGVCWSFAIQDATQTNYKKKTGIGLDLSEWDLGYFLYNRPTDALSLLNGDGSYGIDEDGRKYEVGSQSYYDVGGNPYLSMFGIATGIGYCREENASYLEAMKRMNRYDKAKLQEEKGYPANEYLLTGTTCINATRQDDIKRMLMKSGACTINLNMDEDAIDYTTFAMYSPDHAEGAINHIVTLVGWDDNYDKSKFLQEPKHNGAWLIKNSWGDSWGNDGYFWVSYEEPSLHNNECVFYDIEKADKYDHIYQYDGSLSESCTAKVYDKEANVFTMKKDEVLKAISFYTVEDNTDYIVDVYKNPKGEDLTSGEHIVSKIKGTKEYAGYQLISFEKEQYVNLKKDDVIAVVITQSVEGKKTSYFADLQANGGWIYNQSKSEAGQSFLLKDGTTWEDVSEEGNANLRIKAFTTENSKDIEGELAFVAESEELFVNQSKMLKVKIGDAVANESAKLKFSSTDSDIVSVDQLGNIYARQEGDAEVIVTYKGKEARCTIVVKKKEIEKISKEDDYATEENPLSAIVNKAVLLEYGTTPSYGVGELTWTAECVSDEEKNESCSIVDGSFMAYKEGVYKVVASYENAQKEVVSQEFYVNAVYDRVDCTKASQMKYVNYDDDTVKYFVYKNDNKISTLTFDEKTAVEEGFDYVYIFGQDTDCLERNSDYIADEELLEEDAFDFVKSFTGTELANKTVVVKGDYIVVALVSDLYQSDYGFAVSSIRKAVAATEITFDDLSVNVGESAPVIAQVKPKDATTYFEYEIEDENVATITKDGMVEGRKVGITTLTAYEPVMDKSYECEVEVTTDKPLKSLTLKESAIILNQNEQKTLAFVETSADDYMIDYSVEDESVAQVDEEGVVTALGTGTTTITAQVDDFSTSATITVVAPENMSVKDLQSYHGHLDTAIMQTYTYKAKEKGTECMQLKFDTYYKLDICEEVKILDHKGKELYCFRGAEGEVVEDTLLIPDSTVNIQYSVTPDLHESDEAEEDREDDCEDDFYDGLYEDAHGFRVQKIKEGVKPTGITMVDEIAIDMSKMVSPTKNLKIQFVPENALGSIRFKMEKEEERGIGSIRWNKAFQAVRMGTGNLVATVSFMDEEIASAKTKISVTGTTIQDFSCMDDENKEIEEITLQEGEFLEYNLEANEEFHDETFSITSSNEDIVQGGAYSPYKFYVEGGTVGDATLTITSSYSKVEKEIVVHVVKQNEEGDRPTINPSPDVDITEKPSDEKVVPTETPMVTQEPSATTTPEPSMTATPEPSMTATPEPSTTTTPEPSMTVTSESPVVSANPSVSTGGNTVAKGKRPTISSVRKKQKSFTIIWKKLKNGKKYELQIATNKKFKRKKMVTTKKTKYTFKKLNKGDYYVRVRVIYKKTKSPWSKARKVKIKK